MVKHLIEFIIRLKYFIVSAIQHGCRHEIHLRLALEKAERAQPQNNEWGTNKQTNNQINKTEYSRLIYVKQLMNGRILAYPIIFSLFNFYTVPGKPPSNLTVTLMSDGTAVLSWTHAYFDDRIPTLGYRVMLLLEKENISNMLIVNNETPQLHLNNLQPSSNYTIRVMSITTKGFGEPSLPLVTRTTRKGRRVVLDKG
jgi:hypothetical protein